MRTVALTALAMVAFAGNSPLTRIALTQSSIDAASFTTIRLISGAVMLWLVTWVRPAASTGRGTWPSALALFTYAACFSYAYVSLPAATGALLLFGAVQATMIGYGLWTGERLLRVQLVGAVLAIGGLAGLLLPGLAAPPLVGSLLMLGAGAAWGFYSLQGKVAGGSTGVTAGNFRRTLPLAAALSLLMGGDLSWDSVGVLYAALSGAIASGVGYVVWYAVLPALKATQAATVQLSVPVIAAFGGSVFLTEPVTMRLLLAAAAIIGGIGMVILERRQEVSTPLITSSGTTARAED